MPPSIEAMAPARVARRQLSPTTTGMNRKLTMSFAAQMTMKFTRSNWRKASATGMALNVTTARRLARTFARSLALGPEELPVDVVGHGGRDREQDRTTRARERHHGGEEHRDADRRRQHADPEHGRGEVRVGQLGHGHAHRQPEEKDAHPHEGLEEEGVPDGEAGRTLALDGVDGRDLVGGRGESQPDRHGDGQELPPAEPVGAQTGVEGGQDLAHALVGEPTCAMRYGTATT